MDNFLRSKGDKKGHHEDIVTALNILLINNLRGDQ